MDLLAEVDMHGIQTSGNCIRNITTDAFAGIAPDEIVDPRPYCEILRQWSTLHPEFAFLPRKFKIAVSGTRKTAPPSAGTTSACSCCATPPARSASRSRGRRHGPHAHHRHRPSATSCPGSRSSSIIEAIVRVYNRYGRRDNIYKARIKILVKAEGQKFIDAVHAEFQAILAATPAAAQLIPQAELDRVARLLRPARRARRRRGFDRRLSRRARAFRAGWSATCTRTGAGYRAVTLSLKRAGLPPGDVTAEQMDAAADLADRYSLGELRVTHDQNLLLPWVREADLPALWEAARAAGFATPNIGLLTDMIACPGGDSARWPTPARSRWPRRSPSASTTSTSSTTSATSTCTSAAASTPAATTTAATSASSASTRTAASGTRSRWAAPTAARSAARRRVPAR
jgi:sulfite reductase (NADPH) hemoprotein beta-component